MEPCFGNDLTKPYHNIKPKLNLIRNPCMSEMSHLITNIKKLYTNALILQILIIDKIVLL